jgi:aerobic carbon-monoxide dehydrogenase small subunit
MATIALTVNERAHVVDVEPRTLLVELLRERLRLTGTHVGCDTSQCGACTVWVDGKSVKSCTMLAVEAEGAAVTTIEGLALVDSGRPAERPPASGASGTSAPGASAAAGGPRDTARLQAPHALHALHPMQAAFNACHGLQCGFCTPGMVMSAAELVRRHQDPSEADVRHWLEGNLCRCTGYHNIVRAVLEAAAVVRAGGRAKAVQGAPR